MLIRTACLSDAPALLEIYAPYVENTAITFEYDAPSLAEFRLRMEKTLQKYPYLVLEEEGEILGYAYASPFKERAAYGWAVETSIYLKKNVQGKGYGKALLLRLEEILCAMHILNVNACIAYTEKEDEFLTNASMRFHEKMGYSMAGHFHRCGYKFGRWYDMIWMEKMLGDHGEPLPVIPFPELLSK